MVLCCGVMMFALYKSVTLPVSLRKRANDDGVMNTNATMTKDIENGGGEGECGGGSTTDVYTCTTCLVRQPPRSKHWRTCNHCVPVFDHHCIWIDACVGEGNHTFFLFYIALVTVNTGLFAGWLLYQLLFARSYVNVKLMFYNVVVFVAVGILLIVQCIRWSN